MRILLVSHGYPPEKFGGAEIYTRNLARAMSASHEVSVFVRTATPGDEFAVEEEIIEGIRVSFIRNTYSVLADYEHHYRNPRLDEPFQKIVTAFKPDVIHFTYLLGGLSMTLLERAIESGARAIVTLMDFHYLCPWGQLLTPSDKDCPGPEEGLRCATCFAGEDPYTGVGFLKRWMIKRKPIGERIRVLKSPGLDRMSKRNDYIRETLRKANRIISPTAHLQRIYQRWGLPSDLVPFAIDKSLFSGFKRTTSERFRFGFIGRLLPLKGLHILVEALKLLEPDLPPWVLYVYADAHGVEEKKYLDDATNGAPAGIEFRGTFPHERIRDVFEDMDALVLPSLWAENSPMTLLYALHTATPVIASDIGGVRDVVGNGGAFLYPPRDASGLSKAIARTLRGERPSLAGASAVVEDMSEHVGRLMKIYGGD